MATFHANQVVMVRHAAGELKMSTASLEAMLHQNSARGQQVQRRIDGCPGDPVAPSIHVQVKLIGVKMPIELGNAVDHIEALLCTAVLLPLEEVGKLLLQRFVVGWQRHGHKYTCAYFCARFSH